MDVNTTLSMRGIATAPALSASGQGRIYFDSTANKFKASENGGAYTNLGGGTSYTYYCFNAGFGTPLCVNAGGSQGFCPTGYIQKLALGAWGQCSNCGGPCGSSLYPLPPGGSCGAGFSSFVVGSAYVCSQ